MCNRVFLRHIHQSQSLCVVVFLSQVQLLKPFVVTTVSTYAHAHEFDPCWRRRAHSKCQFSLSSK